MNTKVWLEPFQHSLIVRKSFGDGPEAAERHRASTQWLLRARNHAVVRVRDVDVERLVTATDLAGPTTLWSVARSLDELANVLAKVAKNLGGLHAEGLVHGNLTGSHILIDRLGPILCSPTGLATDPKTDIVAMAKIMAHVIERERNAGTKDRHLRPWLELIDVVEADPSFSAHRLHRLLCEAKPRPTLTGFAERLPRLLTTDWARPE